MISPGKFHLKVPRDPVGNVKFRLALLRAAAKDPLLQRGIIEGCRRDILFFINAFVIQFNPKKKGRSVGPFITWECQEAALLDRPETTGRRGIIWYYENDKSCVVEKSREMGASWLFLIFELWLCLFHDRVQLLNVSRSADAVDCKSPDSLFWKLRFMHEHLPDWMKGKVVEQKMYLEYKRTKSVATGEASTGDAGVGGRASVIFIDEFPKIKEAQEVRQRTANTSDCRFFNGTHLGVDTEFYRLTQSPEIGKIVLHWTQHPEKRRGLYRVGANTQPEILDKSYEYPADFRFVLDGSPTGGPYPGLRSPWYDAKVHDIGSARGAAMELDIDPKGSDSQFFNPIVIRELIDTYCCPPFWEGDLEYDRELARPKRLVQRTGGPFKLWMNPDVEGKPPFGRYAIGADVASGTGATPSCIALGNADSGEKLLEYANPFIEPRDFGVLLVALAWLFRTEEGQGAFLGWEIPGPGVTTGKAIFECGYRHVLERGEGIGTVRREVSPGWANNPRSQRELLEDYRSALRLGEFVNRSESAMDQCRSFRFSGTGAVEHAEIAGLDDPSGARMNHGDQAMADAILNRMIKQMGRSEFVKAVEGTPVGSIQWRRDMREAKRKDELAWA